MCDKSLLFFLGLLSDPQVAGNELGSLLVLNRLLSLEALGIQRHVTTENGGALGLHGDGATELSNELTLLLHEDGVSEEQVVLNALLDADLGGGGVLEAGNGEGQSRVLLVDFSEESTGALHSKAVLGLKLSLEDGGAELTLLGLAFAGGDENVEVDNITGSELELLNTLGGSLLVDNAVVAINKVSLQLVRENTLDGLALELRADGSNGLGNAGVGAGLLDAALGGKESVVGGKNNISLATAHLGVLVGTADVSVGTGGAVSIEVGTDDDLADISFLENTSLILERRVVAHDVVDGDSARESNTSLHVLGLLVAEDLLDFLINQVVDLLGDLEHVSLRDAQLDGLLEGNYKQND